jgi:hypothetical protein
MTSFEKLNLKECSNLKTDDDNWEIIVQNKILNFSFQIKRTDVNGLKRLQIILKDLLSELKQKLETSSLFEKNIAIKYLNVLYIMVGHTRDIINGKGEYAIAYMMVWTWHSFFPNLAKFALKCFVDLGDKNIHQYGSWKDIKYFIKYCHDDDAQKDKNYNSLIYYAINLSNTQLQHDYTNLSLNINDLSLVAKWIPRENSSFGWLYEAHAINFFYHNLPEPFKRGDLSLFANQLQVKRYWKINEAESYFTLPLRLSIPERFKLNCKKEYRKILTQLNKKIDTLQIKQCKKQWSAIDFNNVTSNSLSKQKNAFLNVDDNSSTDRIKCTENFNNFIHKSPRCFVPLRNFHPGLRPELNQKDFASDIGCFIEGAEEVCRQLRKDEKYNKIHPDTPKELNWLNTQWDNTACVEPNSLKKMIAMVNLSGFTIRQHRLPTLSKSIAISIRIAEKSIFGKQIMPFNALNSNSTLWINLENQSFVSQVGTIYKNHDPHAPSHIRVSLEGVFDKILENITNNKINYEDVQDNVLVILAQKNDIKYNFNLFQQRLFDKMKLKYEAVGIRKYGKSLNPPHVLYWDLESDTEYPTIQTQNLNFTVLIGYNPLFLNYFFEKGLNALKSYTPNTPWQLFEKSFNNERYKILTEQLMRELNT